MVRVSEYGTGSLAQGGRVEVVLEPSATARVGNQSRVKPDDNASCAIGEKRHVRRALPIVATD